MLIINSLTATWHCVKSDTRMMREEIRSSLLSYFARIAPSHRWLECLLLPSFHSSSSFLLLSCLRLWMWSDRKIGGKTNESLRVVNSTHNRMGCWRMARGERERIFLNFSPRCELFALNFPLFMNLRNALGKCFAYRTAVAHYLWWVLRCQSGLVAHPRCLRCPLCFLWFCWFTFSTWFLTFFSSHHQSHNFLLIFFLCITGSND